MNNWQADMMKGQTAVITGVSRKIGIGATHSLTRRVVKFLLIFSRDYVRFYIINDVFCRT
jgi:short-subunit dehydrogenase